MSQIQTESSNEKGQPRKQGPKIMFKILNPLMKLILNSPLHGGLSKRVMVISFTGKKTGKHFSTPVAYARDGDRVIVVTYSAWSKNFNEPTPVQMRIHGKSVSGTAAVVDEPVKIKQILQTLNRLNGKEMMQRLGLWMDDLESLSPEAVQQATRGSYFIEVNTEGGQ
jgi:hypothetical protein